MHCQGVPGLDWATKLHTLSEGSMVAGLGWLDPAGPWGKPLVAWSGGWLPKLASASPASALWVVGATHTLDAC